MKRIIIHPERCYGCMTCEAACVTAHKRPGAPVTTEAILETVTPATLRGTRIWVEAMPDSHAPMPVTCRHCLEPACVSVCSIGSMRQDGKHASVLNHQERCAGCWMCVMVCPFGGVDKFGKIALKCDLCQDRESPACVETCPNGALEWADVEPVAERRREQYAALAAGGQATCGT